MAIDRVNRRLNRHGLPFFFQYAVGGAIATAPPILLYALSPKLGLQFEPTVAIAAGLVVLLAGLSLVGSVGDVISGAPVTAAGRFFELVMMTAATIAGVALVLHLANRFGAPFVAISAAAPPALAELPARVAFGAASAAAFALACYAERSAAMAAAFGGAAGTIAFLLAQGAGLGAVVASFVAAVPIGLVGRLMERRNLAPPLVVSITGIVPLLPGLALLHGIYADSQRPARRRVRFGVGCIAIGTALAAGVTLGEWGSWKVRRRRIPASPTLAQRDSPRARARRSADRTQRPPTLRVIGGFSSCRDYEARRMPRLSSNSRSDFGQPAPDAVRLSDGEGMGAALSDHRATRHISLARISRCARARPRSPSGWKNTDESTPRQSPCICQSQISALGPGSCCGCGIWKTPLYAPIWRTHGCVSCGTDPSTSRR